MVVAGSFGCLIWVSDLNSWYVAWWGYLSFFVIYLKISLFLLICSGGSPEMHRILSIGLVQKAPIGIQTVWLWIG